MPRLKALHKHVVMILLYTGVSNLFGQTGADELSRLKKAVALAKEDKDKGTALETLAHYYQGAGYADTSLTHFLEASRLYKNSYQKGDTAYRTRAGETYVKLLKIYAGMGLPEQMKKYAKEARPYLIHHPKLTAAYYKLTGDSYRMYAQAGAGKIEQALVYYDSLTAFCKTNYAPGWYERMALDLGLVDYYLTANDADNALKHIKAAQKLAPEWGDETIRSQLTYMTGEVYLARKEYASALTYLLEAEKFTKTWGDDLHVMLLRAIAESYTHTGNYEKAVHYYQQYTPLRDIVYEKATEQSFANAEAQFQNDVKQQEIENKNLQLSVAAKQRIWLLAGLVLMAFIGLLLGVIYRNKKRTADVLNKKNQALARLNQELEEANRTKARLFGIISHDLRSPINQVYQFLKLQQLNPQALSEVQKTELNNRIQTATGSLLETMEDLLLWSKTQMNEFKAEYTAVALADIVGNCRKLLELNSEARQLQYEVHIPENAMLTTDAYFLEIILRNLLQNAVKAAPPHSVIVITATPVEKGWELTVTNEGGVFSADDFRNAIESPLSAKSLNGLGLKLVAELCEKIDAGIFFISKQPGTTTAVLMIPYR